MFDFGALFPVMPFMFLHGTVVVGISIAISGLILMAIGAVTPFSTGRSFLSSALRQLMIGQIADAITFGVGRLIGVGVG